MKHDLPPNHGLSAAIIDSLVFKGPDGAMPALSDAQFDAWAGVKASCSSRRLRRERLTSRCGRSRRRLRPVEAAPIVAQQPARLGTVRGKVDDKAGSPVRDAELILHLDWLDQKSGGVWSSSSPDIVRKTDVNGAFEVQLPPGFYDMCVLHAPRRCTVS
jgi:hypothetical protein